MRYFIPRKTEFAPYLVFDCVAKDVEDLERREITNAISEDALPEIVGGVCVKDIDADGNLIDRDPTEINLAVFKATLADKLVEIDAYDKSEEVNLFTYKGRDMWVARSDRMAIISGVGSEKVMGLTETTITLPTGVQITLPIDEALQFLYAIESYAKACFNVTANHKLSVSQLTDKQEIKDYDHRANYPNKINIE